MFGGRRNAPHPGEIGIREVHPDLPGDAFEIARMWVNSERSFVAVGFEQSWSPELLGSLLVECVHTAADAYAATSDSSPDDALKLIWKGFDEERAQLTEHRPEDIR